MFETTKARVLGAGAGGVGALVLLGGVAFAQTPEATGAAAPSATVDPGEGTPATPKDEKDCPWEERGPSANGSATDGSARRFTPRGDASALF